MKYAYLSFENWDGMPYVLYKNIKNAKVDLLVKYYFYSKEFYFQLFWYFMAPRSLVEFSRIIPILHV